MAWVKNTAVLIAIVVLPALLAAWMSIIHASYRRDLATARENLAFIQSKSSIFASPYGDIEYSLGPQPGDDLPVVLISHGLTGGIDQGIYLAKIAFPPGCCRFLYVSRFGYSRSDLPSTTREDLPSARLQAAAYRSLLEHLDLTTSKIFVFGNSAGGPSALWLGIDYPDLVRGIVLHSSAGPGNHDIFPPDALFQYNFLYWILVKFFPDVVLAMLLPPDVLATLEADTRLELVQNLFLSALPITDRTDGILFDNKVSTPSVNDIPLGKVIAPTLILQAEDDPRERAAGMALEGGIRDSRRVSLTGGHLLLGRGEDVKKEIGLFLAGA